MGQQKSERFRKWYENMDAPLSRILGKTSKVAVAKDGGFTRTFDVFPYIPSADGKSGRR